MKSLMRILVPAVILLPLFILWSCEKKSSEIPSGSTEFSISMAPASKSDATSDSATTALQLIVSVNDLQGNPVLTDKLIPLYAFGTSYISEKIEIRSGDFRLIKFMVVNAEGKVVYASPVAGSPLAYLCSVPLPLTFHINPGQVTRLMPEVLAVGDNPPSQFGYAAFGMQIIKPLEFWTQCILENPLAMSPVVLTNAKLTISTPDGWHYSFPLEPRLNHLIIRGGAETYSFLLEKEGFVPQKFSFTASQLLQTSDMNPLVLRIPYNQYLTLVLQPGPEAGIDAMISNLDPDKNFGGHKYFEASFISEPVLTVMRSNRSLIYFNPGALPKSASIKKVILTLWYDLPLPVPTGTIITDPLLPSWYGAVFQKITEPWEENSVTWNKQPGTTQTNQVYLSPFVKNANMIEIDVTRLYVSDTVTTVPGYGMMFRLWPAEKFQGFRFVSSDYSVAAMRPRLTIFYTLN